MKKSVLKNNENSEKIKNQTQSTDKEKLSLITENNINNENNTHSQKGENIELNNKKSKRVKEKIKNPFKKPWYKRYMPIALVLLAAIISGTVLGDWYFKNSLIDVDYSGYKEEELRDDTLVVLAEALGRSAVTEEESTSWLNLAKEKGLSPLSLSPSQNVVLCELNARLASSYETEGDGLVSTIATQTVHSRIKFDGNAYSFESISKGMLNIANLSVMQKNASTVSFIKGNDIQTDNATWNGNKTNYSLADYKDMAGGLPGQLIPYIISSKTILEEEKIEIKEIEGEEGQKLYTFSTKLDPIKSVINYVKQVKMISGLSGYPAFNDITITFTIDEDWNLVKTEILEHYSVFYIVKASCTGTLTTNYVFNKPVTLPEVK